MKFVFLLGVRKSLDSEPNLRNRAPRGLMNTPEEDATPSALQGLKWPTLLKTQPLSRHHFFLSVSEIQFKEKDSTKFH
jgi:hypothetical protein